MCSSIKGSTAVTDGKGSLIVVVLKAVLPHDPILTYCVAEVGADYSQ